MCGSRRRRQHADAHPARRHRSIAPSEPDRYHSRVPLKVRLGAFFCTCWFALCAAPAWALDARLQVDAPKPLRELLLREMDMARWLGRPELSLDFLRRLHARANGDIVELLATQGYYAPKIEAALFERDGVWIAHYGIDPGAQARVGNVALKFDGEIDAATAARLRTRWRLPTGAAFTHAAWEDAKKDVLRSLVVERFANARVLASEAKVNAAQARVDLALTFNSGPAFRFGELHIEGLERYPRSLIEGLSPIKAGADYRQADVLELQTRLQNSGYFASVAVIADPETAVANVLPVHVRVSEQPARHAGFGVGFSTDTGPRGSIQYGDRNLRDRGWRNKTTFELDRTKAAIANSLDLPQKSDGTRDSVTAAFVRKDIENEITDTTRLGFARTRPWQRFERTLAVQYFYEQQQVGDVRTDSHQALTGNITLLRRQLDDAVAPRRGYALNTQLGGANENLLADQSFVRVYGRALRYLLARERHGLLLRLELGYVEAESRFGIPTDFLFRAGGDQSIRGYAYQSLGVREGDAVVGGRYLATASAEYTYWLKPNWGVATFYDAGNAVDTLSAFESVAGYGAGLRWRSPVGAVQLDAAYGEALERWRAHFSLGFVF